MRTLLVASQKGGVGKTTTAVNLAALAAAAGTRVLLVDADPLGSVAASLQLTREAGDDTPAVWPDVVPGLDVVSPYPAGDTGEAHLEEFLARLGGSPWAADRDLVVIDSPPMIGPRTKPLLHAADDVLIVLRAEPMGFRTLPAYLELVREVKAEGGTCRLRGVLLTLPPNTPVGGPAEAALRDRFKGILPPTVPYDPDAGRALLAGRPLVTVHPDSPATRAYRTVAGLLALPSAAPVPVLASAAAPVPATAPAAFSPAPALREPAAEPLPPPVRPVVATRPAPRPVERTAPPRPAPVDEPQSTWQMRLAYLMLVAAAIAGVGFGMRALVP
jgi:chromosome partitioning protein